MSPSARILFLDGHRKWDFYSALKAAFELQLQAECLPVTPPALFDSRLHADLVILNDETWAHCGAAIPELQRRGIPTLHLADGILEWRNTWENPRQASEETGMPLFQPVLSSKIACIGRSQARILESWGNIGKCEVTGSPRFDGITQRVPDASLRSDPPRILIATARRPGFTIAQVDKVQRSLLDLKHWLCESSLEPVWRIAPELAEPLGVAGAIGAEPLAAQLRTVHAVITTPSTVQVEAMMTGIPVALLDYLNRPHYVPAAWTISAREHIGEIVPALLNPSPERMLYQDTILHDTVECRTPATPRVVTLAEKMVQAGRSCRESGQQLQLPVRILPDPVASHHLPEDRMRLDELHRAHPVFARMDLAVLQAENGHLRRALSLSWKQTAYRALCNLEMSLSRTWRRKQQ